MGTASSARWFSANPDRAQAERLFLLWTPVWMVMMGLMMITGAVRTASNTLLLVHSLAVAVPMLLLPLWWQRHAPGRWYQRYAFKAHLYIALFSLFGNYVGSEYFFDVLGMVYAMPNATTTLDATLVGRGEQSVPIIMYFYTQAYFMTYHTTAVLVIRRWGGESGGRRTGRILGFSLMIGIAWAWIETRAMANPLMADIFYYRNPEAMLSWGSLVYATYFVASFPIFYHLDESREKPWPLWQVTAAALSASMLTFYLLELCARHIGSLG